MNKAKGSSRICRLPQEPGAVVYGLSDQDLGGDGSERVLGGDRQKMKLW